MMEGARGVRTTEDKFERRYVRRMVSVIAAGLRKRGKVDVPVVLAFVNVAPEHGEKYLTLPFGLAVRVRVVCRREHVVQTHKLTEVLEQT